MENKVNPGIRVLLADSKPMQNQLLAEALRQHGFQVFPCEPDIGSILQTAECCTVDVAVMSCSGPQSAAVYLTGLRTLHLTFPGIPKVFLMETDARELVVQAFRFGARRIFCLGDCSFQSLCECIERVHHGDIWAGTRQLNHLLEAVCEVGGGRVVSSGGDRLLTSREEQVVALVSDGLSNRHVAAELGLSEHTVKKYLFRIFEKLGISNRVELVLYAMHHSAPQAPQWAARA
jgi:DNA-binding NarL/FixJ family response regulator